MTNIWNKNTIITPVSEYQLLYSYQKHLDQVNVIKGNPLSLERPFAKKKMKSSKSNKLLEIQHPEQLENKMLVQKILNINHGQSSYAKEFQDSMAPKPSNWGSKILEMRKLIEDNEVLAFMNQGIERRIKETSSVISFDKIKQEYKKNKIYLKNLQCNSRRIYNCFIPKSQTPIETRKKKKKNPLKQKCMNLNIIVKVREDLNTIQHNSHHTEDLLQQQQQQQHIKIAAPLPQKEKSNLNEEQLISQLNELKLKNEEQHIMEESDD